MDESGVRGKDFDFIARGKKYDISVEVTAKEDAKFTPESVANTLYNKRTQVPEDRSAILYMIIPDEWGANFESIGPQLTPILEKFCSRSKRFNAFVFLWDAVIDYPDREGFFHATACMSFSHNFARHPILDNEFPLKCGSTQLGSLAEFKDKVDSDFARVHREIENNPFTQRIGYYEWFKRGPH